MRQPYNLVRDIWFMRLPAGSSPSPEAQALAQELGIKLPPGYTIAKRRKPKSGLPIQVAE